jgi:Tol biopolymer transport system component/tRNA A-37 threonylcarbamoyl transferase component Bud32
MALTSGTKLGPYEIQSPIGAGGMGEVYKARDTRLDRTVAIKVLNSSLTASPDLKARFEREARAISQLNHPHICTLHDIGLDAATNTDYLVMEFIEGETLAERIRRGPLPLDQVVKVGSEIADALDRAHRSGIVHRDLKPGNVILTKAGAKLLDFGLAKPSGMAASAGSGSAPLLSAAMTTTSPSPQHSPLTQQGAMVGTVQYMSPEQIEGKEADARSDIFAFGAVLYEMATGQRAFPGKSQISVASAILEKEPEAVSKVQPAMPPGLDYIVRSCLHKNPEQRVQSAHDLQLQLGWLLQAGWRGAEVRPGGRGRPWLGWAGAVVLAVAAGAGVAMWRSSRSHMPLLQTSIVAPAGTQFETMYRNGPPALSPDGTRIVLVAGKDGRNSLWLRDLDNLEAAQLPETEGAFYPFWSPDGKSIAFYNNHKLWRMDLNGGTPMPVCDVVEPRGGSWAPGNVILFTREISGAIYRVPAGGGTVTPITGTSAATQQSSDRWPFALPDGKHFLYMHTPIGAATDQNEIRFGFLDGSPPRTLLRGRFYNVQYASGWLLADLGGALKAWKFNPESGTIAGDGVNVANGVTSDDITAAGAFSVSPAGLLLYQHTSAVATGDRYVWVDATGKQLSQISDPGLYGSMRLSPDGSRLATPVSNASGKSRLWVWDVARGARASVSPEAPGFDDWGSPVWSPHGDILYFSNFVNDIEEVPADGSAPPKVLFRNANNLEPVDITADGKFLLYLEWKPTGGSNEQGGNAATLKIFPLPGGTQPATLLENVDPASNARLQPGSNGWLAFQASDSGRSEVYLTKFPRPAAKYQVSQDGGTQPVWSKDGKTLYYLNAAQQLVSVSVQAGGDSVQLVAPKVLFQTGVRSSISTGGYDVSRDGRFLLVNSLFTNAAPLTLVTDWTAELKK